MMIGLGASLLLGTGRALGPVTYVSFNSSSSVDPALPTHQPGDLLIAICGAASATPPTADAGWNAWGTPETATGRSCAAFWKRATASNHTVTLTGESGLRAVWNFRGAALDTINFSSASSTTTLDWEAQPTMTANSLVGGFVYAIAAQTNIGVVLPSGMTSRASKSTSVAGLAFDSDTTKLSSFDPANGTFDTSTSWIACVFSVKNG